MSTETVDIKVSVVIPTKNAGPQFVSVLEAILEQKTKWPFEVVIVDSGSKDGTVELIKSFSRIRLFQISAEEFGHGKTRNFAIAHTKGQYIGMLTQDALPENENWLSELVNTIEADPRIAGVFGRHIAYPEASPFTQYELEQHFNGFLERPVVSLDNQSRYEQDEGYRQFLYFFSDNNALLRRSVWQLIPYPEVDFAEDQAWARLIIEHGYYKAYAHKAVVRHSHNYSLIERFQRSFDENYALIRLFEYQYGQGFIHAFKSFIALTRRDFILGHRVGLFKSHLCYAFTMPIDNFMRVMGYYLGAHGNRIPECIRIRLSRDRKLMMALKGEFK